MKQRFHAAARRRPLLAALMAVLSLFAAAPVAADVLVSNIGQTRFTTSGLDVVDKAQGFTTGAATAGKEGFTLESVEIQFGQTPSGLSVKIATGVSTSSAGTVVETLANPSSLTTGNLTFTAPARTNLSPNTTYFVVIEATDGSVGIALGTNEDSGSKDDWSVADRSFSRTASETGAWMDGGGPMMIRINGADADDVTAPSFSSATVNGTNLLITFDENLAQRAVLNGLQNSSFTVKKTPKDGMEADAPLSGRPQVGGLNLNTLELTLATAAVSTDTFTVAYTKPTAAGNNNKLRDAAGNKTDSFGAQKVTNLTPPPTPTACGADGRWQLRGTFSSTPNSITFTATSSGSTPADIILCGPFGTGGAISTATVLSDTVGRGRTITITHSDAGKTTVLTPNTDYWVQFQSYATGTTPWLYARTKSVSGPTVTIAAGTSPVTEGTAATFTVTASAAPSADLTVNLTVADADDSDFVAAANEGPKTVTITSGSTTATYSVTTVDDANDEDNGNVRVTVATGTGYTVGSTSLASVTVNDNDAPDTAPDFGTATVANQSYTQGTAITNLTLPAATGGNGTLTYALTPALPAGLTFTASARTISGSPTATQAATTYTYKVTDADGNTADSDADTITFTIAVAAATTPSACGMASGSTPLTNFSSTSTSITFTFGSGSGSTNIGDIVLCGPFGTGGAYATSDIFSGLSILLGSSHTIAYSGAGNTGAALTANTNYWVRIASYSAPTAWHYVRTKAQPSHTAAPDFGAATVVNQSYSQGTEITDLVLPAATGGDGTLSYALTPALPEGLTFTAFTRTISGTPTAAQAATTYTYKVTDADAITADSDADTITFTIAVVVVDTAPDFGSATVTNQSYTQGTAITNLELPAATKGNGALTYALTPALPAGLTFTASTRTISGTPAATQAATTYTYKVTDADTNTADSDADTITFTITVGPVAPCAASTSDFWDESSISVSATSNSISVSATTTAHSSTFHLCKTGSTTIHATHTVSSVNPMHTFTSLDASTQYWARVSNAAKGTSQWVAISTGAAADTAPDFGSATVSNQSYTQNSAITDLVLPAATGGNGALTYALTPALPTGLTFTASTRTISGTPTAVQAATTYTYKVSDADANTADSDADTLTFTITVNNMPTISISGGNAVTEGSNATFTVTASPAPTNPVTVNLTITQSGAFVASGNLGSKTVTVPTTGSVTHTVATVGDTTDESSGSVTATLATGTGYTVAASPNNAASVAVNDDDGTAEPQISISGGSAVNEGSNATFTVTASPAPSSALTVNVTVSQSGDFVAAANLGSQTVTVPTTGSVTLAVATVGDTTDESSGSVKAKVNAGTSYSVSTTSGSASVAVNDDDGTAEPVISISGGSAVTEGGNVTFTVTASPNPTTPLTVNVTVTQSGDFVASTNLGSKTVTVPTTGSVDLTVATVGDSSDEDNGSVTAKVNAGAGYSVSTTSDSATVAVNDDDGAAQPVISITGGTAVTEGTNATFTLSISPAPSEALTVNIGRSQSGSYLTATGDITVAVGIGETTKSFTIATSDDSNDEANGSVTATVKSGTGYAVHGSNNAASVTVNDNDVPVISISGGSAVTEGTNATFTLSISPAPHQALTVNIGRTQTGSYLTATGDLTVSVDAGDTTKEFTIATTDDSSDEANGSVTATVKPGTGYSVHASNNSAAVTVNDNDVPVISISGGSAVTEGTNATFTLSISPAPHQALTVNIGRTQTGSYLTATGDITVSVGAGDTTKEFTIATDDDGNDEANGSVTATVKSGTGYNVHGTNNSASVTVNDNDVPVISISSGSAVTEGTDATFTLSISPATHQALTVNIGRSQTGSFLTATGDITVSVDAGDTTKEFTIATDDDSINEANGSVTATVKSGTGYNVHASNNAATVTVNDNDVPVISITSGNAVTEGGNATFTVTASPTPVSALTVNLTITQDGAFVASTNLGSKTVTVPTTGSVTHTVATVGDTTDEANGSVTATVNAGTGYTVAGSPNNAASVAVNDDDGTSEPVISISGGGAVTEGSNATFTVTANPAPSGTLTVNVTIRQSGDYVASANLGSKTVTVTSTGTATLTVATVGDTTDEPNGSVMAKVNSGTGYSVSTTSGSASVAVNDDDGAALPVISISGGSAVTEGGNATFTLNISTAPETTLTVNIGRTQSGDYLAATSDFTVSVGAGARTKSFTIATTNDGNDEANGSVTATVKSGTGYNVDTSNSSATVTVNDNDVPVIRISGGSAVTEGTAATFTLSISPAPHQALTVNIGRTQSGSYLTATGDIRYR